MLLSPGAGTFAVGIGWLLIGALLIGEVMIPQPQQNPVAAGASPEESRAALRLVLASEAFRSSPQLAAFLEFIANAALDGESDRIKSYTIGVKVLRRPVDFDPQLDPTVRVEATRLRRALDRYYAGPGAADPVVIELHRGSYVPTFTRRQDKSGRRRETPAMRRQMWIAAGLLVGAAVIAGWFLLDKKGAGKSEPDIWPTSLTQLQPGNGMPTLTIQDFEILGVPDDAVLSATLLRNKLRDTFTLFETINIGAEATGQPAAVSYRLFGFIDYSNQGNVRVRLSLLDVSDGNIVWTQSFAQTPDGSRTALEDKIVADAATMLLQPFGVIRARDYGRFLVGGQGDPRYRCILISSDAFRSFLADAHMRARNCLERMIALDPGFAIGFSYLAGVYNQEWGFGFGKAADDPQALDTALSLARRGVELRQDSGRAWHILSTVLFNRHDTAAAIAAMERSLALNPYDAIVVADFGGRLVSVGEIERGMQYLQRTASGGSVRPIWQHFFLFVGNYMRDDLREATRHADEMTSENYTFGLFARALTAAANGNQDKAKSNWNRLVALRPMWRENPRGALERFISSPIILDRLTRDLMATGLPERR